MYSHCAVSTRFPCPAGKTVQLTALTSVFLGGTGERGADWAARRQRGNYRRAHPLRWMPNIEPTAPLPPLAANPSTEACPVLILTPSPGVSDAWVATLSDWTWLNAEHLATSTHRAAQMDRLDRGEVDVVVAVRNSALLIDSAREELCARRWSLLILDEIHVVSGCVARPRFGTRALCFRCCDRVSSRLSNQPTVSSRVPWPRSRACSTRTPSPR
jgi:hypothetical protein